MANMTVTNLDLGSVVIEDGDYQDELLTFAGADTILEGTILARKTTDDKLTPYVKGGAGGAEIARCTLTNELVATGAGDLTVRPMTGGKINLNRTVIHADGDATNIDAPVRDQLLQYAGTKIIDVQNLSVLDNQ